MSKYFHVQVTRKTCSNVKNTGRPFGISHPVTQQSVTKTLKKYRQGSRGSRTLCLPNVGNRLPNDVAQN